MVRKPALVLTIIVALSGCTKVNPDYCDADTPCTEIAAPFCDVDGAVSGAVNTCIPTPDAPPPEPPPPDGDSACGGVCSGAAPICDLTDNECRACAANVECSDLGQGLEGCLEGACVECTNDEQCGPDLVCSERNRCVECESGADCPGGACDVDDNECVECTNDEDCDNGVCDSQRCVGCRFDADCGPGAPVCQVEQQVCVECVDAATCPVGAPVCEDTACRTCASDAECSAISTDAPVCGGDGACVECREDSDCASTVCNAALGACVPVAAVVFVDAGAAGGGGCGAPAAPCATLAEGVAALTPRTSFLRLAPGQYLTRPEEVSITQDLTVLAAGAVVRWDATGDASPSSVLVDAADATVTIEGAVLEGGDAGRVLLRCDGDSALTLEEVTVRSGVVASACAVNARRARFERVSLSVVLAGASSRLEQSSFVDSSIGFNDPFLIENSVLVRSSLTADKFTAYEARVDFSTIIAGDIVCNGGIFDCPADNSIDFSNTVFVDTSLGGAFPIRFSNVPGAIGEGSIDVDPGFVGEDAGDYRLRSDSAMRDKADPRSSVARDIDGLPRPAGAADIGAHEFQAP